ncbi:MAG: hypothetical protein R3C05_21345 [Pirellulaceae bacterium]
MNRAKHRRKAFRLERLESRSLLAADAVSLDHLFDSGSIGEDARVLGTLNVRVANDIVSYEVFASRGFQPVKPSGDHLPRPGGHGHPSHSPYTIDPSAYRFTFVALPSLQTRLAMMQPGGEQGDRRLLFRWDDASWSSPRSLQSDASESLPLVIDDGSSSVGSELNPNTQTEISSGSDGTHSEDATTPGAFTLNHTNADQWSTVSESGDQMADPSEQENTDRVMRDWMKMDGERALLAGEDFLEDETADSEPSDGLRLLARIKAALNDAEPSSESSGDINANAEASAFERARDAIQNSERGFFGRRTYDYLKNWVIDTEAIDSRMASAARLQMLSFALDGMMPLTSLSVHGTGSMQQVFVAADGLLFGGDALEVGPAMESESPEAESSSSMHQQIASAVGLFVVATGLFVRRGRYSSS